jgi:SRSO17 transposase
VQFKTKIDLALGMINKAVGAGIPGQIILADAAYGNSCEFRDTVSSLGFDHAVAVQSTTKVRRIGKSGQLGAAFSVAELARRVAARHYRKVTWREATKTALSSRFHFCRVKTTHDDGTPIEDRQPLWLVIEWPSGEPSPTKFFLTTLPRRLSKKKIVRIIKERWRTERMYEDLKGELGLDHFEGRSYPGWHHHVSVVLCCYAFIVAERVRAFPPAARRQNRHRPLAVAA